MKAPMVMLIPLGVLVAGCGVCRDDLYNQFYGHFDRAFTKAIQVVRKRMVLTYHEARTQLIATIMPEEDDHGQGRKPKTITVSDKAVWVGTMGTMPSDRQAGRGRAGGIWHPTITVMEDAHKVPLMGERFRPSSAMVLGRPLVLFYIVNPALPKGPCRAKIMRRSTMFLKNKWYFDELYDVLFVTPADNGAGPLPVETRGWHVIIDGFLNGVAMASFPFFTRLARSGLQSGYLFHYAFAMVMGIAAAMITWS